MSFEIHILELRACRMNYDVNIAKKHNLQPHFI